MCTTRYSKRLAHADLHKRIKSIKKGNNLSEHMWETSYRELSPN